MNCWETKCALSRDDLTAASPDGPLFLNAVIMTSTPNFFTKNAKIKQIKYLKFSQQDTNLEIKFKYKKRIP